jgi:2-phosphosulfolactate phosphatase
MNVQILQLLEGAKEASGLTVIIDVFRAFSTSCYAFGKGAKKIIPVGEIEKAYQLKQNNPEYILMGERNEKKPTGFDFGNSPTHILEANLEGKTIVHTTSSGTQGIAAAVQADEIITGSFVNANAIIQYIRTQNPETVSLVCMGYAC